MPPQESIFRTAFKTFLRIFFGTIALCLAFVLFSFVYSAISSTSLIEQNTTLTILPDAEGKREIVSTSSPAILQLSITGIIGEPKKLDIDTINNILLDSRSGLLCKDRVKGILLYLNTPGGTVVDSDGIYRMLVEYKKRYQVPVVAYVEGLCASGGMYISSSADEIFSGPSGVIGSVGVITGPFFNIYDLMQKIGLQAQTITQGLDKDEFNPTRPWKQNEGASIYTLTAFLYQRFVDVVTTARPNLDRTKLIHEYGAKVFNCVEAQKLGYIDYAMSSRDDALLSLLAKANIDPKKPYQVVHLSPKNPLFSEVFSSKSPLFSGKIDHSFIPMEMTLRQQPCYLYTQNE